MTRLPVKPGIDGLPTSSIPTDPADFVDWFKNSFIPRWAANADIRNATPGAGVKIGGTSDTPGFVGFEEIAGNSVLGNPANTPGDVQAITAGADGQVLQRAGGALLFGPVSVVSGESISGSGTPASPLILLNDAASPGNSQYYGTDAAGNKGYHLLAATLPVYPGGVSLDLRYWFQADVANVSNGKRMPYLFNSAPNMLGYDCMAVALGATGTSTTLNGKTVLAFTSVGTATSTYIFGPPTAVPAAALALGFGSTCFVVCSTSSHAGTNGIIGGTAAPSYELSISTGGALIVVNSGTAVLATSSITVGINTFFQANATYDGTTGNIALRVGRSAAGTVAGATHPLTLGSIAIGAENGSGAGPFAGFIAEVIIYERVLSAIEISAIETYLVNKWGV